MSNNKTDEANKFVAKLKADGTSKDECNLGRACVNYKSILSELPAKDKGNFSLNVLCILCRNLEKVPTWRSKISDKELLELSIDCLRQTRTLKSADQVKTLACVYHIHKHVVRQGSPIPPELVLKLSYMPFEVNTDNLLKDYFKTYWSILADRIIYIEKLKASRLSIIKLLPKLNEDILTVISLYDIVVFCSSVLPFFVKKLHTLYSDGCVKELRDVYKRIFDRIAKDFRGTVSDKDVTDLYIKFSECLYVIFETESRMHFKDSIIDSSVRSVMSILRHKPEVFHCFQTVYLNCFCCIFNDKSDGVYTESVLKSFRESCEATERMGYRKTMEATYPYIAQLFRLYMEYYIANSKEKAWIEHFDVAAQTACLDIVKYLTKRLAKAQQMSKCEGCNVKSGLHDALRISFLAKNLISISISQDLDVGPLLPGYHSLVLTQYAILSELNKLGCPNHTKCLRKLQTDVHNTAITLNKVQLFEYSIKLFNIYLKTEIQCIKSDLEFKNVARALYNKSISELDCKLYEESLKSAYLSLAFAGKEGLSSEKYMSLVMDVKAKSLKGEDDKESLQLLTVFGVCKMLAESSEYGNIKPFLSTLKFSELLLHEFSMYAKLWPSIMPISGVWLALDELLNSKSNSWLKVEGKKTITWCLYKVMLETPTVVRNLQNEHFKTIIEGVIRKFEDKPPKTFDEMAVRATLLLLQSELCIAQASEKHGWKASGPILDPDLAPCTRTVPLEHKALEPAFRAVEIWTEALDLIDKAAVSPHIHHCLQVAGLFVHRLLNMYRHVYGLQLAHVCCRLARFMNAKEEYVRNAGIILLHSTRSCKIIEELISTASGYWRELMMSSVTLETAVVFACQLATYYKKCGSKGTAEMLIQYAQARLMDALDKNAGINLDLAIGYLLEWARGHSLLSLVNAAHRHYLSAGSSGSRWCPRAARSAALKGRGAQAGLRSCRAARSLLLARRARAAAAAALPASGALGAALLHALLADPHGPEAQIKVDNRLKHALGLQPSSEGPPQWLPEQRKAPNRFRLEGLREAPREPKPTPTAGAQPFRTPELLGHEGCSCHGCCAPLSAVVAFRACAIEAAVHFRSGDISIAGSYFSGAFRTLAMCVEELHRMEKGRFKEWQSQISQSYLQDLRTCEVETLLEACWYETRRGETRAAEENLVRALEIAQQWDSNPHLTNEVQNCLIAQARLKSVHKRRSHSSGLEVEMECLHISPAKTPESRPLKLERNRTVPAEELPQLKRRVIRLNLDADDEPKPSKPERGDFKLPTDMTPAPKMPPKVLEPSTPGLVFSTPCSSPEKFLTPMTSIKTYTRKRAGVVKNLEEVFLTPDVCANKENKTLERPKTRGRVKAETKRHLQRATSPGPLPSQKR